MFDRKTSLLLRKNSIMSKISYQNHGVSVAGMQPSIQLCRSLIVTVCYFALALASARLFRVLWLGRRPGYYRYAFGQRQNIVSLFVNRNARSTAQR